MNNEKGYTMVEILIAMAILAIISAPMLNVFTDSVRINRMADDQYRADIIAQKFLEDIRMNGLPDELDTTVSYGDFTVRVLHSELANNLETAATEVSSNFTLPTMDTEVELYLDVDSNIALRSESFDLNNLNLNPNHYLLSITQPNTAINNYNLNVSYTVNSQVITNNITLSSIDDDRAITLMISKNANLSFNSEQNIAFEILNKTSNEGLRKLEIYVTNDQLSNINFTVAPLSNSVKIIRNLTSSTHVSNNNYRSHNVEVTVSKSGTEYTKLKTVISK